MTEQKKRQIPYKGIGVGIVIIGLFAAWRILPMQSWLASFNTYIASLGFTGMVVYGLFYIVATVLFMPGSVTTIGSGFLFGVGWGTLVVSISATTGASLSFLIARYLAREQIAKKANENPKFKAIDRAIGKQGGKIVGLLRLSPIMPFSLSNYLFGLTSVKFWPYVFASWIGTLPGTLMYVYLGALGKAGLNATTETTNAPAQYILFAVGLIATITVTIFISRIAQKALKETT